MSGEVDRYDVEAMIRDAGYSYADRNGTSQDIADLRDELRRLSIELCEQIEELRGLVGTLLPVRS